MICKKIVELLPKFIENDFSKEEYKEISTHLEGCERCRKEYEAMKKLIDCLETMPLINVPKSFKESVMKNIDKIKEKKDG
ncbi:MAG: zf-HC2 domain-containing protein [Acidobacteria bacterium]|nr:zf-HC2 domain-containing protein [Acidobacteriota bacterium]